MLAIDAKLIEFALRCAPSTALDCPLLRHFKPVVPESSERQFPSFPSSPSSFLTGPPVTLSTFPGTPV